MTHTERYNQYVQEWIKENPAFSGAYEDLLGFDECLDKYTIEFAEWAIDYSFNQMYSNDVKELLEEFKKEKGL